MDVLLRERRKKKWAAEYGIAWMDGMPLTLEMMQTFWGDDPKLEEMLEDLATKRYVVKEHPKRKLPNGQREQDPDLPIGYNIVAGKMSYEVAKVLDPKGVTPTLVAMDMQHLYVPDGEGIRKVCVGPTFFRWIFGFGGKIKIVTPDDVVEHYRNMLQEEICNY